MQDFDVDIVVLWVDGNDPEWLKEKSAYETKDTDRESNTENRYRDWGLMKYWFRAVEKYAPWVNKVHFVTWGHVPEFLNVDYKKIHIVNHKDFMPEGSLPTYSSKALELNIHRISGLSERFMYFNDDIFFCKETKKEDFFDMETGLPKARFEEVPIRCMGISPWNFDNVSNIGLINKNFNKKDISSKKYMSNACSKKSGFRNIALKILIPEYFTGFKCTHSAAPFLKSVFEEAWEKEEKALSDVTTHRFRQNGDPNQWFLQYWQLVSGKFKPGSRIERLFDTSETNISEICDCIKNKNADLICINDPVNLDSYELVSGILRNTMKNVFPEKSGFEK